MTTVTTVIGDSVLDTIGNTPLVRLSRIGAGLRPQLVAKLEKLGYVERRVGAGRGVGLYLTPAGQTAQADGNRREEQLEQRLRELLGDEDYAQLGETLGRASISLSE